MCSEWLVSVLTASSGLLCLQWVLRVSVCRPELQAGACVCVGRSAVPRASKTQKLHMSKTCRPLPAEPAPTASCIVTLHYKQAVSWVVSAEEAGAWTVIQASGRGKGGDQVELGQDELNEELLVEVHNYQEPIAQGVVLAADLLQVTPSHSTDICYFPFLASPVICSSSAASSSSSSQSSALLSTC